jgi:aminoglycoside phosphotransferase (APT) family kinase protein
VLADDPLASAHEMELLTALHARDFPVAEPLLLGHLGEVGPCVVSAFVPGQPATSVEQPDLPETLASLLSKLHALDLPRFPWLKEAREVMRESVMRQGREYDPHIDHEHLRALLDERGVLTSRDESVGKVVLHGDPWPGNLLVEGGEVRALLDWEDACFGDPMMDVAIAKLELHLLFGGDHAARFVEAYQRTSRARLRTLPDWELAVACRPMGSFDAWAEGFVEMGREDLTARVLRARHAEFVRMIRLG